MKLYVKDRNGQKIHLNVTAGTREELFRHLGSRQFQIMGKVYNVNQVYAEASDDNTSTGVVVGGLIGILGGPVGILIGGALGGLLGNGSDTTENERVIIFNNSRA
ncbi:hypothetical protein IQ13_1036 [Lacibacter cauensis]|uniref:Glycine zipper domain-containing protein n=1 Tax=Lacibacter cauensis TaxID=510947 RepID=A0A562SX53_9BACT|nr:hypothetical protein [Lacibacter cauensis]TWI85867.1 hypothetical protein IQ13_1036 [Lacibacter cauensis]